MVIVDKLVKTLVLMEKLVMVLDLLTVSGMEVVLLQQELTAGLLAVLVG